MGLDPSTLDPIVISALREDIGEGDLTTKAVLDRQGVARARIVSRQEAVLAGLDLVDRTFMQLDPGFHVMRVAKEGTRVKPGDTVARLLGQAHALLTGERTALNFLQHLSGIATRVDRYLRAKGKNRAILLDTRKTTPGLRLLEKYAVRVGGADNHRMGLFDGILIKENHIVLAGGITKAVQRARRQAPASVPIEIEVSSLEEMEEAIRAGADLILADNLPSEQIGEAVRMGPAGIRVEASGGITPDNIRRFAETGVDRISAGGMIHAATWIDFSLEVEGWEKN